MEAQLDILKEEGIRVYSVGIGTQIGAPIPLKSGGFKKDRLGEVVVTQLQEGLLKTISSETGGAYIRSVGGAGDTRELVSALNAQLELSAQGKRREKIWNERYQWPLGAGLFLLFGAAFLSDGKRASALLVFLLITSAPTVQAAEAEGLDVRDPRALWSLALSQQAEGQYEEAYRSFSEVADRAVDPVLRVGARYNAGNAAYGAGRLDEAVQAWDRALELNPELVAAQTNAESVRQEIARRLEVPPEEQKPQDGENEEGEEDQKDGEREPSEEEEQQEEALAPESSKENPEEAPSDKEEAQALMEGVQEMSKEEAMRLLEAVEEGRPYVVVPGNSSEKDW
jgi:Ca-activated chloride channel family protein